MPSEAKPIGWRNWKGDGVGYSALHAWVRRVLGAPIRCAHCDAMSGRLEWANVSREYRRAVDDWISLCASCHRRYDSPNTCRRGHPRTSETSWVDKKGYPHCRTCRNERLRLKRRGKQVARPHRSAIVERFGEDRVVTRA